MKLIALHDCYGFQGRYLIKGEPCDAAEAEIKASMKRRGLDQAEALLPPPHFRFADPGLQAKAAAAVYVKLKPAPENPGKPAPEAPDKASKPAPGKPQK